MAISIEERGAVDRELIDLGGTPATVLFSTRAGVYTTVQGANAGPPVLSFETVFFDVHSGERYLVKSGQIVKPLERISGDSGETPSESDVGHSEVTKSVYLGSRED